MANRHGLAGLILLANVVFMVLMMFVLPMGFEENDDVVMCMIANGSYSGTPDYHLVFINVIYGHVLAWLYGITRAVEWYTLSFVILHIISMTVLAYCIVTTRNRSRWERILWLFVLYILWARIIVALQFTTTAGLVCLAGCILLTRKSRWSPWGGVLMVVIAGLIRFMAAGLVGVLMAPIIIYKLHLEWKRYIPLFVMVVLVLGCFAYNRHVYNSEPEWRYYREYNQLRAQLNDNPNAHRLQPEQMPEGIDWMDYQLLLGFIPDPEQIDLPAIRQLSAVVNAIPYKQQWRNLERLEKYAFELSVLLALLVLMIMTTGNYKKYIFLILYSLFVIALIIHVSLDGFLKNRVFMCMLLPILMTDFMLLPNTIGKKRRYALCLAMLTLSGWYIYTTNQEQRECEYQSRVWRYLQQPVLEHVPEGSNVITLGSFTLVQAGNPWKVWPYDTKKYTLGWMTWNPLNTPIGHSYRMLLNEEMYVFTETDYTRENSVVSTVCEQLETNYNVKVRIRPICHNHTYALIQICPVE